MKRKWREEISERFELPAVAVGLVKITMSGRGRLMIENHRGVLSYARDRIEVAGGDIRIVVLGENLDLAAMDKAALLISGTLLSVELA